MKKLAFFFYKRLLLFLLALKQVSAGETATYEGVIRVDLCGKFPYSQETSFPFKTELENILVKYFKYVHQYDGLKILSVNIRGKNIVRRVECHDSEDEITKRRLRGSVYSSFYFILSGFCNGSCPDDPSDKIDTFNRLRRKNMSQNFDFSKAIKLEKQNESLMLEVRNFFPKLKYAAFETTGEKISCSSAFSCRRKNTACCGVGDCACTSDQLYLCDSLGFNCKQANFPSCLNDYSCEKFIAISHDWQTLAIGSGFLEMRSYVQVYDKGDDGKWYQRGSDILEPNILEYSEGRGQFGTYVSISNSTNCLTVGYNNNDIVIRFYWNPDSKIWKRI